MYPEFANTCSDFKKTIMLAAAAMVLLAAVPVLVRSEAAHPSSESQPVKKKLARLFILSGQSNAGGNGNGDLLKGEDAAIDPDVLIYRGKAGEAISSHDLEPMAPGVLEKPKEKFGIDRLIFGPELSFAKEMKKAFPDDIIAIAKVACRGGTFIAAWEKDHDREGWREELHAVGGEEAVFLPDGKVRHLYQELIHDSLHVRDLLQSREDVARVEICGFLWVQNENDGKFIESARNYQRNLTAFIANVRADLSLPAMPFLILDVHQATPTESRSILKAGLREVVAEVPATAIVPTEGLTKYHEGAHFDTPGMLGLGRRFAQQYLELSNADNVASGQSASDAVSPNH